MDCMADGPQQQRIWSSDVKEDGRSKALEEVWSSLRSNAKQSEILSSAQPSALSHIYWTWTWPSPSDSLSMCVTVKVCGVKTGVCARGFVEEGFWGHAVNQDKERAIWIIHVLRAEPYRPTSLKHTHIVSSICVCVCVCSWSVCPLMPLSLSLAKGHLQLTSLKLNKSFIMVIIHTRPECVCVCQ